GPVPGGGRPARRLLRPEPVLPALQAPRRRHARAVPDALKKRLTGRTFRQETARRPPLPFLMSSVGRRDCPTARELVVGGLGQPASSFTLRGVDEMETETTLSSAWDQHIASAFAAKNAEQALATMTAEPYVNEVPLMIGARGRKELHDFYAN